MNKNGFTLVELLIAITIGSLIMLAMYSLSEMGQTSSASIKQKVVTQQDTRAVLDLMAMEIRMASYNPVNKDSTTGNEIWVDKDGNMIASSDAKRFMKGMQIANSNELMIEMDLNGYGKIYNGTGGCYENEVIHYLFDSNAKAISRQTGCGSNVSAMQKILGGAGSDTMVANNDTNPVVPLFTYWGPDIDHPDANQNCADIDITAKVNSTAAAKWIPQIRRIQITIVADTEQADAKTKQKRRMTYSTGIIVRNHVLSLPIAAY